MESFFLVLQTLLYFGHTIRNFVLYNYTIPYRYGICLNFFPITEPAYLITQKTNMALSLDNGFIGRASTTTARLMVFQNIPFGLYDAYYNIRLYTIAILPYIIIDPIINSQYVNRIPAA